LGLNKNLDEVRGRIIGTKPLPSICEVFAYVRREENKRKIMLSGETDGMATENICACGKRTQKRNRG